MTVPGKRSQQTAALESGSNVVPREMARLHSGQVGASLLYCTVLHCTVLYFTIQVVGSLLDTPNCSGQISGGGGGATSADTGIMNNYLSNCRQLNDL